MSDYSAETVGRLLKQAEAERDELRECLTVAHRETLAYETGAKIAGATLALLSRYRVALKWVEEQASRHKRGCTDEPEYLLRDLDMIEKKARTALNGTASAPLPHPATPGDESGQTSPAP